MLIWDTRSGKTQDYIYGPMICGDGLDYKNNYVLTGSWREDKQIQLWDLRMNKKCTDIVFDSENAFIYCC